MKKPIQIGPWPLGIDNVSDPTSVRADDKGRPLALVDAINVDIDRGGDASRRPGIRLVASVPGLHSAWSGPGGAYAVADAVVYRLGPGGAFPIGELPTNEPCSFTQIDDRTVLCQRLGIYEVGASGIRALAPEDGPTPDIALSEIGGLVAGSYGIAVAFVRGGQEGALSPLRTVQVDEGKGLMLGRIAPIGDVDLARVYRTEPNGGVLYHCVDVPIGLPSFLIGQGQLGRQATTQNLARLPGGSIVAHWRGRALVARGRNLLIGEPMNHGLYSPRFGFVQFSHRISLVAPVDGGVFVGTRQGIQFLRGSRPDEWVLVRCGALPPAQKGVAYIDGNQLPASYQQAGKRVAVWFAGNGFVLGCDDGTLIEPQGDRLVASATGTASICALSRRVTATLS